MFSGIITSCIFNDEFHFLCFDRIKVCKFFRCIICPGTVCYNGCLGSVCFCNNDIIFEDTAVCTVLSWQTGKSADRLNFRQCYFKVMIVCTGNDIRCTPVCMPECSVISVDCILCQSFGTLLAAGRYCPARSGKSISAFGYGGRICTYRQFVYQTFETIGLASDVLNRKYQCGNFRTCCLCLVVQSCG